VPEQAEALALIAEGGARAFYDGPIAAAIIEAVQAHGGGMTAADLRSFAPGIARPLTGSFRDLTLVGMPPPSSGGIATLETLGILEHHARRGKRAIEHLGHNHADYVHLVAEAMKHAFADRARWLGDPGFADIPLAGLLQDRALEDVAARIDPAHTLPAEAYGAIAPIPEDAGTSHFCVVDAAGMGVSCTETINLEFGSRIAVERFGFFLNNDMDDFTTVRGEPNAFRLRQSDRNLPAPGKRPLSSMSPTILLDRRGEVVLMAGGSGGPRIITGVIQAILNATVFGMTAAEAVGSPRFHHQWWPHVLGLEAPGGGPGPLDAIAPALRAKGHQVGPQEKVGAIQLIRRQGDRFDAASDPRKGGRPAGR
jgi:gamma-glutamyltranspeptidase/glutathione hydrolase